MSTLKNINLKTPNIILIVIDALRAGSIGCYSDKKITTLNIDKIASEGLLFEDAYCTWNTTDPSLTTILTGKYPASHGIINHGDKITKKEINTLNITGTKNLAEILKGHGYKSIAIDWMGRWFKRGFDYYGHKTDLSLLKKLKQYFKYAVNHLDIFQCYTDKKKFKIPSLKDIKGVLSTFLFTKELAEVQDAEFITDTALNKIREIKKDKFFLFLHYWDVHTPYNCPKQFRKYYSTDKRKILKDRYTGAVQYVDRQIGRLFNKLQERKIMDDTLIIITSDHGESLVEHDIYFDHHGLYDETIHVPLIIRHPGIFNKPQRIKGFVQHTELVPTILGILNINTDGYNFDGKNLSASIENNMLKIRPYVYAEESYVQKKRCIRTDKYKYIYAPDGVGYCRYCHKVHKGLEELYDLERDPGETINIAEEKPSIKNELRLKIDYLIKEIHDKRQKIMENNNSESVDSYEQDRRKIHKKLKSLGYMD